MAPNNKGKRPARMGPRPPNPDGPPPQHWSEGWRFCADWTWWWFPPQVADYPREPRPCPLPDGYPYRMLSPPPPPSSVPEPLEDFVSDLRGALDDTTDQGPSTPNAGNPPVVNQQTTHWIPAGWHWVEAWQIWYWYDGGYFPLDYQPYWHPGGPLGYQQLPAQYNLSQQQQFQQSSAPTQPPQPQNAPSGSHNTDPSGRTEDQGNGSGSAGVGGVPRLGGVFPTHPRTWRGG